VKLLATFFFPKHGPTAGTQFFPFLSDQGHAKQLLLVWKHPKSMVLRNGAAEWCCSCPYGADLVACPHLLLCWQSHLAVQHRSKGTHASV